MIATVRSLRSLGEQIQDEDGCDTVELASSSDASSVIMKGILGVKLQDLESLCNGIPVFAAFLRLLDARGLTASIDQLRTERDFQKWLRRHVAGLKGNPLALAQLCAMLPASGKQMDNAEAIASPLKNERLRLQRDGWLSYEQKNLTEPWQVAHHLIADGAVIELLSADESYAPHAVDLLKFAATSDTRKQVLQSLRRVVGEPTVSKVNWSILFERLRDSWQGWVGKIALSGLIEGSRLIEWLTNMQFTTNDLTVHADVRGAIRSTLRDVAQAQRKLTDIERDWVTATFHCASEVAEQAFILSHWLRADQKNENLSALARSWLALNGGTRYAGYVYAAWLESGGDIEVARPMFDDWLTKNNTRHDAVKPIVAWLDATSDVTSGRLVEAVRYWITGKARAQSKGAAYLYRAWLKHGGEFSEIGRQLSTWLSLHSTSFGAQHVFNAWLERIHDNQKSRRTCDQPSIPVELDSVVRIWLRSEEHRTQFRAYYTYVSWLKAKGTPDPVLEPIVQWLTAKDLETAIPFAANFDAGRDVLTSWLLAGLDPKIVQEAVGVWLTYSDNSSRDEVRFIFVGWLAAGGAPEFIREPLKAWLENIPLSSQTEQVLSAWLANGGAVDEVKSYVSRWMVEMPVANLEETDYLVLRWRKAGGERVAVETAVAERAKHFSVSPDVYWNTVPHPIQDRRYDLLASRLKRNEDPIDVFEGAVRAAVNERKDEDTRPVAQILRFWMERHGISGVKILQPEILNWLDHYNLNPQASYVIPALLEIGVIDDQELFVRVTDLATARLRENMGTRNKGDFYVLRGWVRSHRQVEPIADLFRQWLLDNSPLSEKKPKNLLSHSEVSNGRN